MCSPLLGLLGRKRGPKTAPAPALQPEREVSLHKAHVYCYHVVDGLKLQSSMCHTCHLRSIGIVAKVRLLLLGITNFFVGAAPDSVPGAAAALKWPRHSKAKTKYV